MPADEKLMNIANIELLRIVAELEAEIIPGGVFFLFIEGRTIKWKVASKKFDLDIFKQGVEIQESSIAFRAIKERRILVEKVPRTYMECD